MGLSDEMLQALLLERVGAEFVPADVARLRPAIEKQLERMAELRALDLASDDPRTTEYIVDYRLPHGPPTSGAPAPTPGPPPPVPSIPPGILGGAGSTSGGDLPLMSIGEIARLIERRQVSPVEVVQATLERIEAVEPAVHAFNSLYPEQALDQARIAEADIAAGRYRGALHGIPLGIKDNIAAAGWPTTCGSVLMTDHVPDYDATVVGRLRGHGAIVVGKNALHEWAMGGTCSNGPFGTVHNPWDLDRVPGGSSGGSAAAVSASLAYGSVGTDGMGSIRTPSSYCGVVGFKPTYGLVSRFGQLPPTSSTSDHLGPIAKCVLDAAVLLTALAGHDPKDPTSLPSTPRRYEEGIEQGIRGLRVGVLREFFLEQATPEIQSLVEKAVEALAALGAEVRDIRVPWVDKISLVSAAQGNESNLFLLGFARQGPQGFTDRTIWERVIAGQFVGRADGLRASQVRNRICREFAAVMQEVDL